MTPRRCPPGTNESACLLSPFPRARRPGHTKTQLSAALASFRALFAASAADIVKGEEGGGEEKFLFWAEEEVENRLVCVEVGWCAPDQRNTLCLFLRRRSSTRSSRASAQARHPHHHVLLLPRHEPPAERGPGQRSGQQVRKGGRVENHKQATATLHARRQPSHGSQQPVCVTCAGEGEVHAGRAE